MFVQLLHAYTATSTVFASPGSMPASPVSTPVFAPLTDSMLPLLAGARTVIAGAALSLSPAAVALGLGEVAATDPFPFVARTWYVHDTPSPHTCVKPVPVVPVVVHGPYVVPPSVEAR